MKTIPNEKLMKEAMSLEKFFVGYWTLTHWYVNPNGNDEDGILQEDEVSFVLIRECLEAYEKEGTHKAFWTHWDDNKTQYNHDNQEGEENFIGTLKEFINEESDYPVVSSQEFIADVYHEKNKEAFEKFLDWLRSLI